LRDHAKWLAQVGVLRHHQRSVIPITVAVIEQKRGEIYVRALFLCIVNLDINAGVADSRSPLFLGQEAPVMDPYLSDARERTQVSLLTFRSPWVARAWADTSGEISKAVDGVGSYL
jgi:hypothetical protein